MAESRFKVKFGNLEIEHEGTEAFIKAEIPILLATIKELYPAFGGSLEDGPNPASKKTDVHLGQQTTNGIAKKLIVGNGPELIIAVVEKLHLIDGSNNILEKKFWGR